MQLRSGMFFSKILLMETPKALMKKRYAVAGASAAVFYFLVHGYRFFNPLFSGDALLMIYQNDAAWQIALGRFAQGALVFLRGGITSPFLISLLAVLWTALAVCFAADLLQIKSISALVLNGAIMGVSPAMISANANFLPWVDFYALALFLAVLGVWLVRKGKLLFVTAGILALCGCMAIYQAYICVAIGLFMIGILMELLEKTSFTQSIKKILTAAGSLFAAALLYYLVWKVFQKVFHIWTSDSYNGLATVGDYSQLSVFSVLGLTYRNVWLYFWEPLRFITMTFREKDLSLLWVFLLRAANLAVPALILYFLFRLWLKKQSAAWSVALQLLILLLFPFGINFVCFLSKGMEHSLMTYAFCLVYLLAAALWERWRAEAPDKKQPGNAGKTAEPLIVPLILIMSVQLWAGIVYANQVYLKKQAQEEAARSLMTRILCEIESADGYVPGVTPVAFTGSFETSPYIEPLTDFRELLPWGTGQTALTYIGTDFAYLKYFENMRMNLTRVDASDVRVQAMPAYPLRGSVAMVDDVVVVKISD